MRRGRSRCSRFGGQDDLEQQPPGGRAFRGYVPVCGVRGGPDERRVRQGSPNISDCQQNGASKTWYFAVSALCSMAMMYIYIYMLYIYMAPCLFLFMCDYACIFRRDHSEIGVALALVNTIHLIATLIHGTVGLVGFGLLF